MNAVEVEHVSIRFNLASEQVSSLKEYLIKLTKKQLLFTEFYALQDISFTLPKGESLGIVGVNGSGKSTLLKVIAGIYMPYQGSVRVSGVIAPLIELGAGFDGELTARENIFLNGFICRKDLRRLLILRNCGSLSMCRSEIIRPVWPRGSDSRWQRW